MTAGWVAATVRGRALLTRTVGRRGAAEIATASDWSQTMARLSPTVYGTDLAPDAGPDAARSHALAAAAWQIRVLAGWLPPGGAALARTAVAPFEIAAVEHHLAALAGAPRRAPVPLGSLGGIAARVAGAGSPTAVRAVLARSSWGDPGGDAATDILLGMRVAWARRAARAAPSARGWAAGGAVVLTARERFVFGREIAPPTEARLDDLIGPRWRSADGVDTLRAGLPRSARWVLDDVGGTADLWRAELTLLDRVVSEARPVAHAGRAGRATVVAVLALLLVDAWRILAAIEGAASGDGPIAAEVLDAVA